MNAQLPPWPPSNLSNFMGEDQVSAIQNGESLLKIADGKWDKSGTVVDIGCGYGRLAYALLSRGFTGHYLGLDILPAHIRWLSDNFAPRAERFIFQSLDIKNDRYNASASEDASAFRLNVDRPPSLILVLSVFTHMYEADLLAYLREIARVMDGQSLLYATFFLLNSAQSECERRGISKYPMGVKLSDHCSTYDANQPLHAISYDEPWLVDQLAQLGLFTTEINYGVWCGRSGRSYQDTLFIKKFA